MLEGAGDIEVSSGDTLFEGITPQAIKIDFEGMEIAVLRGWKATISRARPLLLIEVDTTNDEAFQAWTASHGDGVVKVWQRYRSNRNYLLSAE